MADGATDRARELWDAGMQASLIAAAMGHGCTKSALLGYAHRHSWPPRPSPIGNGGVVVPRKPPQRHRKAPGAALAELVEMAERINDGRPAVHHRKRYAKGEAAPPPGPPRPVKATLQPVAAPTHTRVPVVALRPVRRCQFPETANRPWRFCDAPVAAEGCSWCAEHYARTHTQPLRRHAEAAA
jgi:hypothetical protein